MQESKIEQIIPLSLEATDRDHSNQEPKSYPRAAPYPSFLIMLRHVTGAQGTVIFNFTLIPVYQQRPMLIFGRGTVSRYRFTLTSTR